MKLKHFIKDKKKLSKIATIIIFIALLRSLYEPFRLQTISENSIGYAEEKPFLLASLLCAFGLLSMTILSYYRKYNIMIIISVLCIIGMLIIKKIFLLP